MKFSKKVKVYKQGATSITIPVAFCQMLNINPGDELNLSLDTNLSIIQVEKIIKTNNKTT